MGIALRRIDDPFFPPRRGEFDAVVVQRGHFEAEPLMIGRARYQRLRLFKRDIRLGGFSVHAFARALTHGVTTTLPKTSRSWMRRKPSIARSSGRLTSITGFISPCWISAISPFRSSS